MPLVNSPPARDDLLGTGSADESCAGVGAEPGSADFTAPVAVLAESLDVWDGYTGGVQGWVTAHGAAPDLADRLRRKLSAPPLGHA